MSDASKTSTEVTNPSSSQDTAWRAGAETLAERQQGSPFAPPSIALARMAWELAYRRAWGRPAETRMPWMPRGTKAAAHGQYFQILDRLAAGEAP